MMNYKDEVKENYIMMSVHDAFRQTDQNFVYFGLEKVRIEMFDKTGCITFAPLITEYKNNNGKDASLTFSKHSKAFFERIENMNYMVTYDGETEERLTKSSLEVKMKELGIEWVDE